MRRRLDLGMILIYLVFLFFAFLTQGEFLGRLRELEDSSNLAFQENLDIGSFFYFMLLITIAAFIVLSQKSQRAEAYDLVKSLTGPKTIIKQSLTNFLNLFVWCLIIQFVFQGYMLMRAATYYQIFMLLILPNFIEEFPNKVRPFLGIVVVLGMVYIFYYATLLPFRFAFR